MDYLYVSRLVLSCFFVWSVAVFRTSDGSGITWHEPPPFDTVTDTAITSLSHKNLTQGFLNEELSCGFNLTADLSLSTVWFELKGVTVASYFGGQSSATVPNSFASHFNATWVPPRLTLIVFNVTSDDKGEYYCKVQTFSVSSGGQFWNRKIEVDVLVQSQITSISGETVTEGGNVTLKCSPKGNPPPSFTWRRLSDNSVVTMPLTNVRRKDAGKYRCIAVNGVGKPAKKDVWLIVEYPVEATGRGANATVLEGEVKIFSCPVDGNPEPNIKWYNSSELSGGPVSIEEHLEATETGCYTCVASNSLGPDVNVTQCLILNTTQELLMTIITTATSTPISEGSPWTLIGILIGVAVLVALVVGPVMWWMLKKRKWKKDTKRNDLCNEAVKPLDIGDSQARKASSEDQQPDFNEETVDLM